MNITIIALSQFNRILEQRKNKRPMLSDLRESGALEKDADMVIFIHREAMFKEVKSFVNPDDIIAEILLSKHRNGETGMVKLFLRANINLRIRI